MKLTIPDYYYKFSCKADKCVHNCCIGWEIDIDDETYNYYKTIKGALGEKLRKCISEEDYIHFILGKDERCPFLNNKNLCELIMELGEDRLCNICADHPRFRNFFDNRTEMGIGLCCEAAGELILKNKEKVKLVDTESFGEERDETEDLYFFDIRKKIFDIIQNRSLSFNERVQELLASFCVYIPQLSIAQWAEKYLKLERLNPCWDIELASLRNLDFIDESLFLKEDFELAFEQLLVYFIYRHLSDSLYDGRFTERIAFSLVSTKIIKALCAAKAKSCGSVSVNDMIEFSRQYSSEVEYCRENTESLIEFMEDH